MDRRTKPNVMITRILTRFTRPPSGVVDLVDQVTTEYIDGPISQYFITLATLRAIVDDQNIGSIQADSRVRG